MDNWEHVPFDLIKDSAYGDASLNEVQRRHCYNCEECAELWATFKREADIIEKAKALRAKTDQEIARLLKEHPPKSREKSA